jgi:hypothetical protein
MPALTAACLSVTSAFYEGPSERGGRRVRRRTAELIAEENLNVCTERGVVIAR